MAKDPKRQLLGKIARQKGQYFEQRLDGSFDYYRDRGFALIEKTPEPMKVIKPEGNGVFSIDRKSTRLNSSHVRTYRMPSSA